VPGRARLGRGAAITKEALHQLIDELPDDALEGVAHYLSSVRDDPMMHTLMAAPLDEPPTAEEDASAREAIERYRRGDFLTAAEAKARLLG
jgi:hypothetical protein